jgi:hypothetical protein
MLCDSISVVAVVRGGLGDELLPELTPFSTNGNSETMAGIIDVDSTQTAPHSVVFDGDSGDTLLNQRALEGVLKCARKGWFEAALLALEQGNGDPSEFNNQALFFSARDGAVELARALLGDQRVLDGRNLDHYLQTAVQGGHVEVVECFLLADVWSTRDALQKALCLAAELNLPEVVALLLKDDRVDPTANRQEALIAASRCSLDCIKVFLEDGRVDLSADDSAVLLRSAQSGGTTLDFLLQQDGVDPSADDSKALRIAAKSGQSNAVYNLLVDGRADPSARDCEAVRCAGGRNKAIIVDLLLRDPRVNLDA